MHNIAKEKTQSYINQVCSQIKLREAHPEIKIELEAHILENYEEFLKEGYSVEKAIDKAIAQMGNATDIGKQFAKIHKPRPEWGVLGLSTLFVSIGILLLFFIEKQELLISNVSFENSIVHALIGLSVMIGLYFFDYRKLEAYSKYIYLASIMMILITYFLGINIAGKSWIRIGSITLDFVGFSPILFCIALAGIFNNWDWQKLSKVFFGLLLCAIPLMLILFNGSLVPGIIYSIMCITLLIVSNAGWKIILLWSGIVAGVGSLLMLGSPYRIQRLISLINPNADPFGSGYIYLQIKNVINSSGLYGHGFTLVPGIIPEVHTDFIFTYIIYTFGWIAGLILAGLIIMFLIRMINVAIIVKNNYAKLIMSGLVTIFSTQFIWYILMNLGLAPISGISLPFISYGGSQVFFNAVAIGAVLSIYRRKSLTRILN